MDKFVRTEMRRNVIIRMEWPLAHSGTTEHLAADPAIKLKISSQAYMLLTVAGLKGGAGLGQQAYPSFKE